MWTIVDFNLIYNACSHLRFVNTHTHTVSQIDNKTGQHNKLYSFNLKKKKRKNLNQINRAQENTRKRMPYFSTFK